MIRNEIVCPNRTTSNDHTIPCTFGSRCPSNANGGIGMRGARILLLLECSILSVAVTLLPIRHGPKRHQRCQLAHRHAEQAVHRALSATAGRSDL